MNELKPNTILCNGKYKYRILESLGQGGFGITYHAKMIVPNEFRDVEVDVAIKECFLSRINTRQSDGVSLASTQSPDFIDYRKKFKKEAVKLSKLSQFDDIVKVHEVFDENGTSYYSMDYVAGCHLGDYIREKYRLSEKKAIEYIKAIARALQHLHEINMVHLDLKPENIMRNNEGKLFLIDFGLTKQYDDSGNVVSTTTNTIGGLSKGYAPPEQYHEKFDGVFAPTLDIYALGAIFYKMLTGETPQESIFIRDFSSYRKKLSVRGIKKNTIAIIEKAMQWKKEDRYQSVAEFLDALPDADTSRDVTGYVEIDPYVEVDSEYDEEDVRTIRLPDKTRRKEKTEAKKAVAEPNGTSSNDETLRVEKTVPKKTATESTRIHSDKTPKIETSISNYSNSESAEEIYEKGLEYYKRGEYKKAVDLFQRAANMGNPYANYYLALCFENGQGVEKSSTIADLHYEIAAKYNVYNAQEKHKELDKKITKRVTIGCVVLIVIFIVLYLLLSK